MGISKAVVTGGAGFIGSNLVNRLIDEGTEVLVVDDLSTGMLSRLADARKLGHVHFHQIDIRAAELRDVFISFAPEVVFHLAAQIDVRASVADPVADASINVLGTINVLLAARDSGVDRVVFSSSGGATFGDTPSIPTDETIAKRPDSPYGVSKKIVDDYLDYFKRTAALDYVSLGFANVYGPGQDPAGEAGVVAIFSGDLLAGRTPTIYGDGLQTRDYVFVEDVTDACWRASLQGGGRYLNIGTSVETTVVDLYDKMARIVGSSVRPNHAAARAGEQRRSALEAKAAKEALGWEPWTSLDDGLAQTIDWFRKQ
ncbi:MAG: GDP-mannose 4,6-dehydratase [Actinomycetota bacterium]|nr:GDP-mannose 4,6-dehydratase [Actinomycetota bacterium]